MKKALLFFAVVAFAFSANAQIVISGNVGLNTTAYGASYDGKAFETNFARDDYFGFFIQPKVGYQINDRFTVGAYLGYTYTGYVSYTAQATDPYKIGTETVYNDGTLSFGLFGRMNFCSAGAFTFFGELSTGIGVGVEQPVTKNKVTDTEVKGTEHDFFLFEAKFTPGFNYAFNEHFSADLYLNLLGLTFSTEAESYKDAADKEIVEASASFGLNCSVKGNSAVTMGINYKF